MKLLLVAALAVTALAAAQNALTPEEKQAGWILLFDGQTTHGWRNPGDSWIVENGCLKTVLHPRVSEDLITEQSFGDFDLKFDWRVSQVGNTGVKYLIQRAVFIDHSKQKQDGPGGFEAMLGREITHPVSDRAKMAPDATGQVYTVAFECQLVDDERHPDARRGPLYTTGALYSFIAPTARAGHAAGEWNTGRIVLRGRQVEHWINGIRVMEGRLDSDAVREGARKRWSQAPEVMKMLTDPKTPAPFCLQHHGDEVWFRNIRIQELP